MLRHYLLTIFRHLWKRRLYSFISLVSLTLGLSIACLTVLHVRHELSYNSGWPDAERIYRMTSKRGGTNAEQPRSTGFGQEFIVNITEYFDGFVSDYAEIFRLYLQIEGDEERGGMNLAVAEASMLNIFSLQPVAGSLERVMESAGLIALERERAETLFGTAEAAMGERLELSGQSVFSTAPGFVSARPAEFEVAAVYELPQPITFSVRFEAITADNAHSARLFPEMNGNRAGNASVWVKLREGVDVDAVDEQLDRYLDEYLVHTRENLDLRGARYSDLFDFKLQALEDIHFGDVPEQPQGNAARLLTFGVVAALVLLAGSSNVVSLGLAAAMERRREVGIRKAVGALQANVMSQHLGESLILALMALIPVLVLVYLLHAPFANLLSVTTMPDPGLVEYLLMIGIALAVGVANGVYPAFVLSRVKPVAVLKTQSAQTTFRRVNLRSVLVTLQFSLSIVLLIVTSGLYVQLWVTRNQPLGLNADNLAVASVNFQLLQTRSDIGDVLAAELARVPGISGASTMLSTPLIGSTTTPSPYEIVRTQQEDSGVKAQRVSFKPGLFDLLGIPLLAGRDFDSERDTVTPQTDPDSAPQLQNVIINRSAMSALGLQNPQQAIGERFFTVFDYGSGATHIPIEVIGVVEDSMVRTIEQRPGAEFYYFESFSGPTVLFRYDEAAATNITERVSDVIMEVSGFSGQPLFMDERIEQFFAQEQRESRLLLMCAALALSLSCIGLYGLVSVALRTQVKEIGVRKVLGAGTGGIVGTFLKRFSVPVLLANLVAWPLAVYFVLRWIQQFPYQLEKSWLLPICLTTTAVVLLIAWLTVGALTWRAASTRPVKSLRYE